VDLENYFHQIPTLHSRDSSPTGGPSVDTKFGDGAPPILGHLMGKLKLWPLTAPPLFTFRDQCSYLVRGHRGALHTCQNWGSWGIPFGSPKFLPSKFFFDYGSTVLCPSQVTSIRFTLF